MPDSRTRGHDALLSKISKCRVQTPHPLAKAMVAALGDSSHDRWLEPCVGEGHLLQALSRHGVSPDRIRGLDLDPETSESDRLGRILRATEFLGWASSTDEVFDKIIANPPYLPLSQCPSEVVTAAVDLDGPHDLRVRPGANCWCAFLIASLRLLHTGGCLCFVLPAAWEYADYAGDLRQTIAHNFREVSIHRSLVPLFTAVQEGSIVLIATGYRLPPQHIQRRDYASAAALLDGLGKSRSETLKPSRVPRKTNDPFCTLGEELTVSIGAVTGDNGYFLLSEDRRTERGLPRSAMHPVLTRARHLRTHLVDQAEWNRLRDSGKRVWLFRPRDSDLETDSVDEYLALSEAAGGCRRNGYKVSRRSPWHRTPLPAPPHGFVSGMSSCGPWISLNGMEDLNATNTLYTVRFSTAETADERAAWALALLTTDARKSMQSLARRYPDGLLKYEPGDLQRIAVPVPKARVGALEHYGTAVAVLLTEGPDAAAGLADAWFASHRDTEA